MGKYSPKEFYDWIKTEKGITKKQWLNGNYNESKIRLEFYKDRHPELHPTSRAQRLREDGDIRYQKIIDRAKETNLRLKKKFVMMLGGKCQICDYHKCIAALEFHHKNPKDKWSANTFSGYNQDPKRFERDIRRGKIALWCANCHKEYHFNRRKRHRPSFVYKKVE